MGEGQHGRGALFRGDGGIRRGRVKPVDLVMAQHLRRQAAAPRNTRPLIKFVQDTGRFPRLFYVL
jgi:hypothetical protein